MTELGWHGAWRLARRDLTAGFRGLRLLFVCLLLGVTTLATIGSLTTSIQSDLAANGQTILGGDLQVEISQRFASDAEKTALRREGRISETVRTQAMARRADDAGAGILTELKAIDRAYPLYGEIQTRGPGLPLSPGEIIIDPALAERLSLRIGDPIRYGEAQFRVKGLIENEPDRIGEGFTFGPVALVSLEGILRTKLLAPGSLYRSKYRIRLPGRAEPQPIIDRLKKQHEAAGWEFESRTRAAPGASRFFDRMGQFLSLIGLAALVIAGIGVGNGVASYLTSKQDGTATLKVLGASSGDVARIYLLEIGLVAGIAVSLGLAAGALLPAVAVAAAGDLLPVQPGFAIHPLPLLRSATYGILIALIFALPPLARARRFPAAALFRSIVDRQSTVDRRTLLIMALAIAAVVILAVTSADSPSFAGLFLAAVAGVLALLAGLGAVIRWLARRIRRPRLPLLRLAVANLHRPGSQTTALVIALGLSLTLFVAIAAIQTSLRSEIGRSLPARAPDQFVLDIPASERARFASTVRSQAPAASLNLVPTLRGTIVAYDGKRVADLTEIPPGAWFLRGDRGVTYSETIPESSELVAGAWWPPNYTGRPLISLDEEAARTLDIGVGDSMTVSILGREIEARIASLRKVNWRSLGFNYILVFSPNSLATAPHTIAATITIEGSPPATLTRAILTQFPSVSVIDVGELAVRLQTMLEQMAAAILISASVTVLAGIAVLVGAIAASRQARLYDSVVMKVLGATRSQILWAQALEYALLSLVLTGIALALGLFGAWYVIVQLFEFGWAPDWPIVLLTVAAGGILTLLIGMLGSLPILAARPAQALRSVS